MPYNSKQCRLFGAKQSRGESVPSDWKEKCTKAEQKKAAKRKAAKRTV